MHLEKTSVWGTFGWHELQCRPCTFPFRLSENNWRQWREHVGKGKSNWNHILSRVALLALKIAPPRMVRTTSRRNHHPLQVILKEENRAVSLKIFYCYLILLSWILFTQSRKSTKKNLLSKIFLVEKIIRRLLIPYYSKVYTFQKKKKKDFKKIENLPNPVSRLSVKADIKRRKIYQRSLGTILQRRESSSTRKIDIIQSIRASFSTDWGVACATKKTRYSRVEGCGDRRKISNPILRAIK